MRPCQSLHAFTVRGYGNRRRGGDASQKMNAYLAQPPKPSRPAWERLAERLALRAQLLQLGVQPCV